MKIFDPKLTGSIEIQSQVSGSIVPTANETFDLGTAFFRWNDLYLAGSTIDLGGTKMSKDADGNVEFKDSSNNRKKIIVEEIVIGSGDNQKRLKVENGKSMMVDKLGAVMTQMAGLIMPHSHDIYDLGTPETQWKDIFAQGNIIVGGTVDGVDIQAMSASVESNENNISVLTGATGSYLLNTTDTLTGNLTVTGTLTAQEFHTEFVSASILYDSGSTKFGDTSDDNHDFTGSLNVLGNIALGSNNITGINTLYGVNANITNVSATNLYGTFWGAVGSNATATTQAAGDNSTKVATTAYANAAASAIPIGNYLPLAGGDMTGQTTHGDGVYSYWGDSNDLQIGHDGGNSYIIDRGVGDLLLYYSDDFVVSKFGTSEISIRANQDSSVELFFDNTKKFETTSAGVTVTGQLTVTNGIEMTAGNFNAGDGERIRLGNSADLQIYHDGSHSYINDTGVGALKILASQLEINNAANTENLATFTQDGAVSLFYDNSKKFETTSAGISVTGEGYSTAGWGVGTGETPVGKIFNSSGVFSVRANTARQIAFGNVTNGEAIRIDTVGNVGIGTTNPDAKLHVAKNGNANGGSILMGLQGDGTNKWSYLAGTHYNQATTGSNGVAIIGSLSTGTYNKVFIGGNPYEINPATQIEFWTHSATTHSTGGSQRGYVNSGGDWFLANTLWVDNADGNVGIGTTSPGTKLDVSGTGYYSGQLTIDGFTNNSGISFRKGYSPTNTGIRAKAVATANRDGLELLGYNGIDFTVNNGANVAMRIVGVTGSGMGNVGIGTTSPSAKLEVNGNIKHTGLTPTEGTDIDQIKTFTVNLTVSSDWIDTGISYNDLATGTYTMQCTFNDSTNGSYSMGYVGTIMWYGGTTNDGGSDEILTHRAGHAPTSRVHQFRTIHSSSVSAQQLRLQIKQNNTPAAGTNYTFKFRRLI